MPARHLVALVALVGAVAGHAPAVAAPTAGDTRPVVIAVVGEAGANVLHEDFTATTPRPPAGAPAARAVTLPDPGPFEERLAAAQAGVLGRIPPGQMVQIAGTRLFVYNAESRDANLLSSRKHGTGVLGAAASRNGGTAPDAIYVFVLGSGAAWNWVAQQDWIDVATSSVDTALGGGDGQGPLTDTTCSKGPGVRRAVRSGQLVLSAAGNGDPGWHAYAPSALPEVLRVGGHDADGALQPLVTTPFEVSDLFLVNGPDPNAQTGTLGQVGTSFAAPRAAGRAARLLTESRRILRDGSSGIRAGQLAVSGRGVRLPPRGPLADGSLTNAELRELLQQTATPRAAQPEARYVSEGFGALGRAQTDLAQAVLRGQRPAPEREVERAQHEQMQQIRAALTHPARCG